DFHVTGVQTCALPIFPPIDLPIHPPFPPMEARTAAQLPESRSWVYEPKWDGFRGLAFRKDDNVLLQSKAGQPLGRYFPELVEARSEERRVGKEWRSRL